MTDSFDFFLVSFFKRTTAVRNKPNNNKTEQKRRQKKSKTLNTTKKCRAVKLFKKWKKRVLAKNKTQKEYNNKEVKVAQKLLKKVGDG